MASSQDSIVTRYYQIRQICNQRYIDDPLAAMFDEKQIIYTNEIDVLEVIKEMFLSHKVNTYFNDNRDYPVENWITDGYMKIPTIYDIQNCKDYIQCFNDDCLIVWINVLNFEKHL
jgi:hypothetical protein